jgi:hypothetical protein
MCRYVVTVLNKTTKAAIAGILTAGFVADVGNGSVADDPTAQLSELIYVADMNNRSLSFEQGFESGLEPTNGTATTIVQALPDGSFVWSMEMASKLGGLVHKILKSEIAPC